MILCRVTKSFGPLAFLLGLYHVPISLACAAVFCPHFLRPAFFPFSLSQAPFYPSSPSSLTHLDPTPHVSIHYHEFQLVSQLLHFSMSPSFFFSFAASSRFPPFASLPLSAGSRSMPRSRVFYFFRFRFSGLALSPFSCVSIAVISTSRLGYLFPRLLIPRLPIAVCCDFCIWLFVPTVDPPSDFR